MFLLAAILLSSHMSVTHGYFEVPSYKIDSAATNSVCQGAVNGSRYITKCEVPIKGGENCCGIYSVNTIDYSPGAFCSSFRMRCQFPMASIACYVFSDASGAARWITGATYSPATGSYVTGCQSSTRECMAVGTLQNATAIAPTLAVTVNSYASYEVTITLECLNASASAPAPALLNSSTTQGSAPIPARLPPSPQQSSQNGTCVGTLECPWLQDLVGANIVTCDRGEGQYWSRDCTQCITCNSATEQPANAFVCVRKGQACVPV